MERRNARWWTVWGALILIWAFFPLLWMISLSFKDPNTFRSETAHLLPEAVGVDQLRHRVQ